MRSARAPFALCVLCSRSSHLLPNMKSVIVRLSFVSYDLEMGAEIGPYTSGYAASLPQSNSKPQTDMTTEDEHVLAHQLQDP